MTETLTNLPTLLLAKEHLDPSRGELVAKIHKPTKSTEYYVPEPGELMLLAGDGGSRVVTVREKIHETEKHSFYAFVPARETDAHQRVRELAPAYAGERQSAPGLFDGENDGEDSQ